MKILIVLALLVSTLPLASDENKIVYLISTPRSLSTGFLRMMQARKDFVIFHEPTNAPYDAVHHKEFYEETFRKDCFHSYEEITESIYQEAKYSNVFIKEVAFTLDEFLTPDNPLLQTAHFVFLIRKPQDVLLSFYRKGAPASILQELAGYRQISELFESIATHAKNSPLLLFSEDLGMHPQETVSLFCDYVGIPFIPSSLRWEDLGDQFTGYEWRDGKKKECVHHWHGDAIHSTAFRPLSTLEIDPNGEISFDEVENLEDRAFCLQAYLHNLPYYTSLVQSISQLQHDKKI